MAKARLDIILIDNEDEFTGVGTSHNNVQSRPLNGPFACAEWLAGTYFRSGLYGMGVTLEVHITPKEYLPQNRDAVKEDFATSPLFSMTADGVSNYNLRNVPNTPQDFCAALYKFTRQQCAVFRN